MKLNEIHSVYFVGIGGIGMSALARWFKANGYFVAGYDKTQTPLTNSLQTEGISIHFSDDVNLIPQEVKNSPEKSLIVHTPAVPVDHSEYAFFQQKGYTIMKRSQVLGELTKKNFTIAIAGTHGKTTTSSIVAHILKASGVNCTAFVGGIMANYNSNLIIGTEAKDAVIVVEADEFDRSFLTLHPDIAVVTAVDADHLDIYGSGDALKDSFKAFISNINTKGKLFIEEKAGQKIDIQSSDSLQVECYGLSSQNIHAENIEPTDGAFAFTYTRQDKSIEGLHLALPGFHNVENSLAAISVARELQLSDEHIETGIASYRGVKRRFEYIIKTAQLVYIDDYAHHPEEITALLKSVRALFPNKKITAVFQPHLFTRTRDFAGGFSESLSLADEVVLLDIYPAREKPIEGVNSAMLLNAIAVDNKYVSSKENLISNLKKHQPEVLLTIGAGDIDALVQPIKEAFQS